MKKAVGLVIIIALIFGVCTAVSASPEQIPNVEQYKIGEEILALRSENSKTYYLGKGQYQAEISSGILHYKDNYDNSTESWKDINLEWNGRYLDTAPYTLNITGNQVTFIDKKTGDYVVIEPIGVGEKSASLTDINLVLFNEGIKLQRQVELGDSLTGSFKISSKGASVQVHASATDANNAAIPVEYSIKDGILTETITDSKNIAYPITIDPTLTIQPSSKDNYMVASSPATSYGDSTSLTCGYVVTAGARRPLVELDIGAIPAGRTIVSAVMSLYYYSKTGAPPAIYAYRLLRRDWVEGFDASPQSCWTNYKSGSAWTTAGASSDGNDYTTTDGVSASVPGIYGWMSWTITNQVATAYASGWTVDCRLSLNPESGWDNEAYFYSKEYATSSLRPKLVVVYTSLPVVDTDPCDEAPTYLDFNGEITDTGSLTVTERGFCYREGTEVGWISPTGFNDPDSWTDESKAYDENTALQAYTSTVGGWIELTHDPIFPCSKVRIFAEDYEYIAGFPPTINHYDPDIDIDVYYSSAWHNIFSGSIAKNEWVEKEIGSVQTVEKARVKFNSIHNFGYIYEFDFNILDLIVETDSTIHENGTFEIGTYSLRLSGLGLDVSYLVRAYAINSFGTGYGDTVVGTTLSEPWVPVVDTDACTDITATSMQGNADITYDGGENATRRGFVYAEDLKYALQFNGVSDYIEIPYLADYYANTAAVENFEWGNDAAPLSNSGGSVTWSISVAGTSKAEIDMAQKYLGTRSARLYRDGTNSPVAYFTQTPLTSTQSIEFLYRKDDASNSYIVHGNGTYRIVLHISHANEHIYWYDGTHYDTGTAISINTWYLLSIRNVDWTTHTYDIYLNGSLIKTGAAMHLSAAQSGQTLFDNESGTSEVWLDNILVGSPSTWTYETWINRKADSGTQERLLSYSDASILDRFLQIQADDTVLSGFTDTAGTDRYVVTTATIPLNTDTHLATSFDGTYIEIRINGVLSATSASLAGKIPRNNKLPLQIGRLATYYSFEGIEDELRNWNDERTQAEIQNNMCSELVGNEAGLVGYWKLDEGTGTTAEDSTSNNNDGTISGADWVYQSWDLPFTGPRGIHEVSPIAESGAISIDTGDATILYNGYIYTVGRTFPAEIAKINASNYSDVIIEEVYRGVDDSYGGDGIVEVNGYLWFGDYYGYLYKIDPGDLSVEGYWQIFTGYSSPVIGSICTDGVYIYLGAGDTSAHDNIGKFQVSDSSITTNYISISNGWIHALVEDGDYLYGFSRGSIRKALKIQKSDLSLIDSEATAVGTVDDMAQDDNYFYFCPYELGVSVAPARFSKDDLSSYKDLTLSSKHDGMVMLSEDILLTAIADNLEIREIGFCPSVFWEGVRLSLINWDSGVGPINDIIEDGDYIHVTRHYGSNIYLAKFSKSDILAGWDDFLTYEDGSFSEGEYSLTITGLTPETWYRVRGFADNSVGIGYGDIVVAETLVAGHPYSWGYILGA